MAEIGKVDAVSQLDPALTSLPAEKTRRNDEVGKNEFMQLLVAQLKAQDPLDPMKNEDFAVNLAQFSQLEELVAIKENLSNNDGGIASMAGYLGQQVLLDGSEIQVKDGYGGQLALDVPINASNLRVQLVNGDGGVAQTIDYGEVERGQATVDLSDLTVPGGNYGVRVSAQTADGSAIGVSASVAGIVTGFVPGAEPTLLLGDREISPAEIKEVRAF
ncbi:MAG: hypothetical protein KDD62_08260 [Bdellovibrionales bacterium]|nr:hypothetical protein [Bdellovibrionales bacterium]